MDSNTATTLALLIYYSFVGFLVWRLDSAWPLVLLLFFSAHVHDDACKKEPTITESFMQGFNQ